MSDVECVERKYLTAFGSVFSWRQDLWPTILTGKIVESFQGGVVMVQMSCETWSTVS